MNVAERICAWSRSQPDKVAIAEYGANEARSYARLAAEIDRWAGWLRAGGLRKRDPVLLFMPQTSEPIPAYFGMMRSGSVLSFIPSAKQDAAHYWHLVYAAGRSLLFVDEIDADAEHDPVQWFHFSPHMGMKPRDALVFGAALRSGRRLTVRAATIAGFSTVKIRGQVEPVCQGWVSQAYGQLSSCDTRGYRHHGRQLTFATLLSIDDRGSTLNLRDGALEARIRTDEGVDIVHASWRDGNCRMACQHVAGAPVLSHRGAVAMIHVDLPRSSLRLLRDLP